MDDCNRVEERLRRARVHFDEGRDEAALDQLVRAWSMCGTPSIAGVIEALGARLRPTMKPVRPRKGRPHHQEWLSVCRADRAADLDALLAGLLEPATKKSALERVDGLSRRSPDPRVARFVVDLLLNPRRKRWGAVHAELIELASQIDDPASSRELIRLAKTGVSGFSGATRAAVETALARSAELVDGEEEELEPELRELVAQFDAELHVPADDDARGADLLAAVRASPEDDEPRSVYADWLLERGDPQGERIALQLARGRGGQATPREMDLIAAFGREWLGPLDPILRKDGLRYERGFLAACHYGQRIARDEQIGCPIWATVEEIDVTKMYWAPGLAPVLLHPILRALRSVRGLRRDWMADIAVYEGRLPWTSLGITGMDLDRGTLRVFERWTSLPALTHLDLSGRQLPPSHVAELLKMAFGRRVRSLSLDARDQPVADVLRILGDFRLDDLRVSPGATRWLFRRSSGQWHLDVACHRRADPRVIDDVEAQLRPVVEASDAGTVQFDLGRLATPEVMTRLNRAARRAGIDASY